jgi:MSHA pilin protein MshA
MNSKQKGFTLVELVVVIVILGILAATAVPRFATLSQNATTAAANGMIGAMLSAVSLCQASYFAAGVTTAGQCAMLGASPTTSSGATAGGIPTADGPGIGTALGSFNGWTQSAGVFTLTSSTACKVTYLSTGTASARKWDGRGHAFGGIVVPGILCGRR